MCYNFYGDVMKVLLHICCAPCSIKCIDILKEDKYDVNGYWYNPNIHPYTEYKLRMECLKEYSKLINLDVIYNDEYGLVEFTKNVIEDLNNRCSYCYRKRLEETVKYAKENNFDAFSTTLLISPYQKHEQIKELCEQLSIEYDIKFIYKDYRNAFKEGQNKARELELYMQKYCGCIFSEKERYLKNI